MRALLDSHLSPRIARLLRDRGLDVVAVVERGDISNDASDAELMEIACREARVFVTNDLRDSRAASDSLADAIESIVRANPDGLDGGERWIGE